MGGHSFQRNPHVDSLERKFEMIRQLSMLLLIVVFAVPSLSTPAHANDDFKKFLAALAIMGVIGVVAERERDNPIVVPATPAPKPKRKSNRGWGDTSKKLPKECFKSYRTSDGKRSYFSKKCLRKNYEFARTLPRQCERKVWTKGKKRSLYSPNCLQHNGYHTRRREY